MGHEWVVAFDAASRLVEAAATILAVVYARHGARLAKRTAKMLGTLPSTLRRRRRRPAAPADPHLDQLKAEADSTLAAYLEARRELEQYTERPTEGRHR